MGFVFKNTESGEIANEISELIGVTATSLNSNISSSCDSRISLILSLGRQDVEGWTTEISLCELLDSMTYVEQNGSKSTEIV